jgi:hypothetical protein
MIVLTFTAIVVAVLIAATLLLVRMMSPGGASLPVTSEWINDLSTEQYRPMLRLLDSADIEFLRSQPGYSREMESKLRQQRCQVFRGYLRCLNSDFQRVCMALKVLMAQSEQDRPDLAGILMHQQLLFATGMLSIHGRLLLYRWGICRVDVSGMVRIFDRMRAELCTLVPSAAIAAASA